MAIDINNANYKLFTDFVATATKQTTRAAIGTLLTDDGVPEDYDLIIADYAKDTKAQLGMAE